MIVSTQALGNTGLITSKLALGLVKLGRTSAVKYPNPVTIPTDKEALQLLAAAEDLGINLLDTAPAYGKSEARLGKLLAGQRSRWLISTKVGEEFDGEKSSYDFSPEACRISVERSLKRLSTDYLDIVLIHSDGNEADFLGRLGTLQALLALKDDGKIRAVGISHKTVAGAELAMAQGADVIMATLNKSCTDEVGLIAMAGRAGVGVLIKKALDSGYGQTSDLAWIAAQPGVGSIVVGTTNTTHLTQNAAALRS